MANRCISRSTAAAIGLLAVTAHTTQAQNTVSTVIQASITSTTPGMYTAGSIDSCYVTAVFNTNAYIQDSTGGIYLYKGANATQGFPGLVAGDQITGLSNGGSYFYTTGTQWEYEPATSTAAFASTAITIGTYQSIPTSYYTTLTLSTFNSSATQGSSTSQGMQNQLVTLGEVTISGAGGTFAAGTYTMTDAAGNTGILYVNAASGIVGATIPSGPVNASGVLQSFHGTSELLPRGAFDLAAVPEPSAKALATIGTLTLLLAADRPRRARRLLVTQRS